MCENLGEVMCVRAGRRNGATKHVTGLSVCCVERTQAGQTSQALARAGRCGTTERTAPSTLAKAVAQTATSVSRFFTEGTACAVSTRLSAGTPLARAVSGRR